MILKYNLLFADTDFCNYASDAKIITGKLGDKLKKVASLRNILIHKYWEIDDRKVLKSAKENIGDFEEFLRQINEFIKI